MTQDDAMKKAREIIDVWCLEDNAQEMDRKLALRIAQAMQVERDDALEEVAKIIEGFPFGYHPSAYDIRVLKRKKTSNLSNCKAKAAWAEKAREALKDFCHLQVFLHDCYTNKCVDCKKQYEIRANKARDCLAEYPKES